LSDLNLTNSSPSLRLGVFEQQEFVVQFMSEKTGLELPKVRLVIDTFIFFLKRTLLDYGVVRVPSFGDFYVYPYHYWHPINKRRGKNPRYIAVAFKAVIHLRMVLAGREKLGQPKILDRFFSNAWLVTIEKMFSLSRADVQYLFSLYIYAITLNLIKYNVYKFNRFGKLTIVNRNHENRWICKHRWKDKEHKPPTTKHVKFIFLWEFKHQLNREVIRITVTRKLVRLFHYLNVDKTINPLIAYDYQKVKKYGATRREFLQSKNNS